MKQESPSFQGGECQLVYRKLAQDVAGFWQFIAEQGHDGEGCPHAPTMSLLAAKLVGRWPSGTPLVLAPDQDNPEIQDKNQFKYLPEDKEGYRCPIGAHIRRSNPRDSFLDSHPREFLQTIQSASDYSTGGYLRRTSIPHRGYRKRSVACGYSG
ncbi:hypothetical protein [Moorena producens]|uniref:hypothetical protein n=1 Tax=Moorena producens TaxID=1155739 RepID=UPI003C7462EE